MRCGQCYPHSSEQAGKCFSRVHCGRHARQATAAPELHIEEARLASCGKLDHSKRCVLRRAQTGRRAESTKEGEMEIDGKGEAEVPPALGHRRIGEAENPGPGDGQGVQGDPLPWSVERPHDGLQYPRPHRPGFRDVWSLGFDGADNERTEVEEAESFQLVAETVNGTSWGPLRRRLRTTGAHIVLAQETKISEARQAEVSAWAIRNGLEMVAAPAIRGKRGGASAGVAIFVRNELGVRFPTHGPHILDLGRAVAAIIEAPACRPILVVSLYLRVGTGLDEANMATLGKVGACIQQHGDMQSLVGGDRNTTPEALTETGFADRMGARVIAPTTRRGTCRTLFGNKFHDYFIASCALADCMDEVAKIEGTNVKTHTPVQLTFQLRQTSLKKLTLRLPEPPARERVYGPLPPPPSWQEAKALAEDAVRKASWADRDEAQAALDNAYQTFADVAEQELSDATGKSIQWPGHRGSNPSFVWRSVLPEHKPAEGEPTCAALGWLEGLCREVGRAGLGKCPPTPAGTQSEDAPRRTEDSGNDNMGDDCGVNDP